MLFSKPYPMDYRRPLNAEAILDNQLDLVLSLLREKGIKEDEIAIASKALYIENCLTISKIP